MNRESRRRMAKSNWRHPFPERPGNPMNAMAREIFELERLQAQTVEEAYQRTVQRVRQAITDVATEVMEKMMEPPPGDGPSPPPEADGSVR